MANWADCVMLGAMGDWDWKRWIVFGIPFILVGLGVLGWFVFRSAIRTRLQYTRMLEKDPTINDWLVVFNWSRKVLYIPTIVASLVAALLMLLVEQKVLPMRADLIGGCWLLVFFLNFLIDEYEVSFQIVLTVVLLLLALGLWLTFLDWLEPFFRFLGKLGIVIDSLGYLMLAFMFSVAVIISWLRGLFYYAAITPNFINIQNGPSENGEQISREEYNTKVDTGDFLERLLGFGRLIIVFDDTRRHPLSFLVWRISSKSRKLEQVRGKLEVDSNPTAVGHDAQAKARADAEAKARAEAASPPPPAGK